MQYRRECLASLAEGLLTKAGILVHDILHFFHGDSSAMQFEAGNKIGGYCCCVGCDAHSSCFDDLPYCFHACHLTAKNSVFTERHGNINIRINPLDNLKVAQLQTEERGYNTILKG